MTGIRAAAAVTPAVLTNHHDRFAPPSHRERVGTVLGAAQRARVATISRRRPSRVRSDTGIGRNQTPWRTGTSRWIRERRVGAPHGPARSDEYPMGLLDLPTAPWRWASDDRPMRPLGSERRIGRAVMTAARGQGQREHCMPRRLRSCRRVARVPRFSGTRFHVLETSDGRTDGVGSNRSVMTPGVAPRSSVACTLQHRHMTDDQTTLSEFFERRAEEGDEPSPERNAADIEHLIGVVEDLAEDVGTLTEELESEDGTDGIDTKPTDATERMFQ